MALTHRTAELQGYVIRTAIKRDATALSHLIKTAGASPHLEAIPRTTLSQQLREWLPHHPRKYGHNAVRSTWVAEKQGMVAAYVSVHWSQPLMADEPQGTVTELLVTPEHQKRGLGAALIQMVQQEARHRHCPKLMIMNQGIGEPEPLLAWDQVRGLIHQPLHIAQTAKF